MLDRVEGGVADARLGIDRQPRLPLGGEDVLGVQVGAQQHRVAGAARQLMQQR